MPSLLCLDLGTSASKAVLIALDGTAGPQASSDYPTRTTAGGGAEQDPRDWLRAARRALAGALQGSEERPLALSITGQMQDLVLLTDGEAAPAILYSDTRAADEAGDLRKALHAEGVDWDDLVGNEQDATSCAAMFLRLTRTDPGLVHRARGIVFGPAGHLVHELGLGAWCDVTTASATGLLEHRTGRWSQDVAKAAGIAEQLLPRLTTETGQIVGRTGADAGALLGLPADLPVVLAPGDAGATTLGIVGLEPGDDYAYLGTSGWLATVVSEDASASSAQDTDLRASGQGGEEFSAGTSHRLALGAGASRRSLRISALLAAGAAADWARDAFLGGAAPEEADLLLEKREAEHGRGPTGLLALPSIQGERYPVRDANLRAAVVGMDGQTRSIDLYAAVLEGVAQAIAHAIKEGESESESAAPARSDAASARRPLAVVGGGARSEPWMRILADVTGRPVHTVPVADAALVGCALAAADALGLEHHLCPLADQAGEHIVDPAPSAGPIVDPDLSAGPIVDPDPSAARIVGQDPSAGRIVAPDPSAVRGHSALRPSHRALYAALAGLRAAR
ncbi:FGGY family carbohydrate kinase [Brachybacterium alimentarium]|uniref:FGGY family carbohydrate kinase n=1 Tax=Brachybacterium alimentarium TaxID=47845 RepID=UPI003FD480FD